MSLSLAVRSLTCHFVLTNFDRLAVARRGVLTQLCYIKAQTDTITNSLTLLSSADSKLEGY